MATPIYGPALFAPPALTTQPGLIQLAGAFGGTYLLPTVLTIGANNVVLPITAGTAGQVLALTDATHLAWTTPSAGGGGSSAQRVVTDTWSTSLTPNSATTDIYRVILSGTGTTINTPSGTPTDGQKIQIRPIQDGTGSRTVTWGPGYAFSTDNPVPTLSTANGALDIFVYQYDANKSKWLLEGGSRGY